MAFFIFGRFHANAGREAELAAAIQKLADPTRAEPGCQAFGAYRSLRNPRLFYIHSQWSDEAAFDRHADLPHTVSFIEKAEQLIDHDLDIARSEQVV